MPDENSKKVYMKIHKARGETVVAMCDCEVLGKTFKEGGLRITVNERFYRGYLVDVDECDPYLREASIGNFVGDVSVSKAIKLGLVDEKNVIRIEGVPHAQMVRMFI